MRLLRVALLTVWMSHCEVSTIEADDASADAPVAIVNGTEIPASQLEVLYLTHQVADEDRAALRAELVDELIDRQLIAAFLESRRTQAPAEAIDARLATLRQLVERGGHEFDAVLANAGVTEQRLREALSLPLAWQQHANRVITNDQIEAHWLAHRRRLDGTKLRVSQIVHRVPPDGDRQAATDLLAQVWEEIKSGRQSFADAAREHSQSPSSAQGGDVGWITADGGLPREVLAQLATLEVGAISEPIASPFGVHLVTVTEIVPGQLSLEDVRGEILVELGEQLWQEQVSRDRKSAKIKQFEATP
jgi:parvulin-like peptidyl-prolyl isomerase